MTKYIECGCETNGVIIMEESIFGMFHYFQWAESVGVFGDRTICFDCWNKKKDEVLRKNDTKTIREK